MVIVAVPSVSPPEQTPVVVIVTSKPELELATTSKLDPFPAETGACVVTVIV
jgi:hypothetical protein